MMLLARAEFFADPCLTRALGSMSKGASSTLLAVHAIPTPLKMEFGEGGNPWNSTYGSIFLFHGKTRGMKLGTPHPPPPEVRKDAKQTIHSAVSARACSKSLTRVHS